MTWNVLTAFDGAPVGALLGLLDGELVGLNDVNWNINDMAQERETSRISTWQS